ncbi:MAG TPA: tail fiber domain-containing protein, partial [candidate division Zixibacteria bacterium]|nr:tail fiber domain-containing protein [candidate division Zixibacteria bacterium]
GLYASCKELPNSGYGGYFEGGYTGVFGKAHATGADSRFGVNGYANGGAFRNYGVRGQAGGDDGTKFGVYGYASGDDGIKHGVYGTTYGLGTNWAGYFDVGDVHIANNLGIGTEDVSGARLTIEGTTYGAFAGFRNITPPMEWRVGTWDDGTFRIVKLTGSTFTPMVIDTFGNIGVGTMNPDQPLHVEHEVPVHSSTRSPTVYARVTDGTDEMIGILAGENGYQGVYGYTSRDLGYGVFGRSTGGGGRGVYGYASGDGIANYGVFGYAIDATNNYGLFCSGDGGYTGSWTNISDIRFKKNVRPMEGILDRVMMLQPKTFEMKTDEFSFMNLNEGTQYGLIAQELKEVFPELVVPGAHPDENNEGFIEYEGIDYIPLTAILIQAVQEQQAQIEELKAEIEQLKDN